MTNKRNNDWTDIAAGGIFGIMCWAIVQLIITVIAGIVIAIRNVIIWLVQKWQAHYRKKHSLEPIDYVKNVKNKETMNR